jgi:hypothetical protein
MVPLASGQALGPKAAVRKAQSILGPTVQAAMYVYPRGRMQRTMTMSFGLVGYFLRRNIPKSSLPDLMLLSLDDTHLYLHEIAFLKQPRELGRWPKGDYGAVTAGTGWMRNLTFQLDELGTVELESPVKLANRPNLQVLEALVGMGQKT